MKLLNVVSKSSSWEDTIAQWNQTWSLLQVSCFVQLGPSIWCNIVNGSRVIIVKIIRTNNLENIFPPGFEAIGHFQACQGNFKNPIIMYTGPTLKLKLAYFILANLGENQKMSWFWTLYLRDPGVIPIFYFTNWA